MNKSNKQRGKKQGKLRSKKSPAVNNESRPTDNSNEDDDVDSILQANRSQLLRSIDKNEETNLQRIKTQAIQSRKVTKGRSGAALDKEDAKESSDDYAEMESSDEGDGLRIAKRRKKEEIDIVNDDTVPKKKNKNKGLGTDGTDADDMIGRGVNRSFVSQNQLDRSSVKSSLSKKRGAQTVEDYIAI